MFLHCMFFYDALASLTTSATQVLNIVIQYIDLASAKSEDLVNICSLLKQNI